MSAMVEENALFEKKLKGACQMDYAGRTYTIGSFKSYEIVLAFSRWGKVAAAITAMHLINIYKVDVIIFTGVAAAVNKSLEIGDIVIAESLIQHDMDARPFFARYEIPLTGIVTFQLNSEWSGRAYRAGRSFLIESLGELHQFGIVNPQIHRGCIASGDKVFASRGDMIDLQKRLPSVLAVEMEGAAVAQVCHEHKLPCAIIRTISDNGKEKAPEQFQQFSASIASRYSLGILEKMLVDALEGEDELLG